MRADSSWPCRRRPDRPSRRRARPGCRASRAPGRSRRSRAPTRAPSAARIRPHDGSPPKMPDLTRLPPATARARSRAIGARRARPATSTTSSLVAPSPSAATARARSPHSAVSAACSFTKSVPSRSIAGAPDAPVGERDHRVVGRHVAVDGDGVERLVDRRRPAPPAAPPASPCASVAMKQSIVAICGWIIPEPLAMAANVTALAADVDLAEGELGAQVGGPDRLGGAGLRRRPARPPAPGAAAAIRSTGSRMPIPPVDAVSTVSASTPSARRDRRRHRALVDGAAGSGERVGVAAVRDDGPDARRRQPRPRHSRRARRASG